MPDDYDPATLHVLDGFNADRRRPGDRYPVEDGPGSGRRVEIIVRVLIGTERSTVILAAPDGRAVHRAVVDHGAEPTAAAAAIEAAIRDRLAQLQGAPDGVAGGAPEPLVEPGDELGARDGAG